MTWWDEGQEKKMGQHMQISIQPLEEIAGVVLSLLRLLPAHYAKFATPWGKE